MSRKLDGQAMQQWQDICTRLYNHAYNLHKASRHTKVRYARILESFLQQSNLNEPLVTKDWLKAALSLAPGMVSNSVSVVCACTSAQQYWPLAIQLLQVSTSGHCYAFPATATPSNAEGVLSMKQWATAGAVSIVEWPWICRGLFYQQ